MPLFFPVTTPIKIEGPTKKDARASEKSPAYLSALDDKSLATFNAAANKGIDVFACPMPYDFLCRYKLLQTVTRLKSILPSL